MGHRGGYLDLSYFRAEEARHLEEYRKAIPYLTVLGSESQELLIGELKEKVEELEARNKTKDRIDSDILRQVEEQAKKLEELRREIQKNLPSKKK
jgi:Mn-containing catalase